MGDKLTRKLGFVYIYDTKRKRLVGEYSYANLFEEQGDKEYLKSVLGKNKDYILVCGCQAYDLEIKISSDNKVYRAKHKTALLHDDECPKSVVYEKKYGVNKVRGGGKSSTTAGSNAGKDKRVTVAQKEKYRDNYIVTISPHKKEDLLYAIEMLNLKGWELTIRREGTPPESSVLFAKKIFGYSNAVKVEKSDKNLNEFYYNPYKDANIKPYELRFVYTRLKKVENAPSNNDSVMLVTLDVFDREQLFYAKKELFQEASSGLIKGLKTKIMVAGFVRRQGEKVVFHNLCMINISNSGLYCKNEQEYLIASKLEENKLTYYKPSDPLPEYNNLTPDIVVMNNGITQYIEIFREGGKSYLDMKEKKIARAKSGNNCIEIIRWNAYKQEPLPIN